MIINFSLYSVNSSLSRIIFSFIKEFNNLQLQIDLLQLFACLLLIYGIVLIVP